jgi:hypothetical protein
MEALAAIEEAAGIYRQLAGDRPGTFLPDLAMSLKTSRPACQPWGGGRRRWPPSRKPRASTGGWPPTGPAPSCPTSPGH